MIKEQLREGIIERVTKEDCAAPSVGTVTYLPHQHVLRPDKETIKLSKLIRVDAFILHFVRNIRARISKNEPIVDELKHQEIEQARLRWLLASQAKINEDLNFRNLKSNLNLFEDEDKLFRSKGRIGNAPLPFEIRSPVNPTSPHYQTFGQIWDTPFQT